MFLTLTHKTALNCYIDFFPADTCFDFVVVGVFPEFGGPSGADLWL